MFFSRIILALSFSAGIFAIPVADALTDIVARNAIIARQPAEGAVNCSPEEKVRRGIDPNADADEWYETGC